MKNFLAKIKSLFFEDVQDTPKPAASTPQQPVVQPSVTSSYTPTFPGFPAPHPASIAQNNDVSEAIIIACYFNPMKSPYRLRAFKKFYEGIKRYNHKIIECTIGDSVLELHDLVPAKNYVSTHTKTLLWHKETLLNNLIKQLPVKIGRAHV